MLIFQSYTYSCPHYIQKLEKADLFFSWLVLWVDGINVAGILQEAGEAD